MSQNGDKEEEEEEEEEGGGGEIKEIDKVGRKRRGENGGEISDQRRGK